MRMHAVNGVVAHLDAVVYLGPGLVDHCTEQYHRRSTFVSTRSLLYYSIEPYECRIICWYLVDTTVSVFHKLVKTSWLTLSLL